MPDFDQYLKDLFKKLGAERVIGSWEDARIEEPAGELYACVFEAREPRATVVFIPGTSIYALCYAELMHGLMESGVNVVGFDPRGQGRSFGFRGDYTIMEHVEDAKADAAYACERFGGKVFAMGSSQGGIEAFYMAATDEPGVDGAICHNIADLTDEDSLRLTRFGPEKRVGGAVAPVVNTAARGFRSVIKSQARLFPTARVPISSYLDLKSEPMRHFGNAWNFITQDPLALRAITFRAMSSIANTELPRPVEEIETPVMVLHSSGDNIFPLDYVKEIFERLTCDKELKVYEGLPHLVTIEHVDEILPDVVGWIEKHL